MNAGENPVTCDVECEETKKKELEKNRLNEGIQRNGRKKEGCGVMWIWIEGRKTKKKRMRDKLTLVTWVEGRRERKKNEEKDEEKDDYKTVFLLMNLFSV